MEREYKSLSDLAREAAEAKGGICCPKCGCRDMRVYNTNRTDGGVRRRRHCRNCGEFVSTKEVAVDKWSR